jgi:L-asparaginase/Glu-tRNA(Gln) amidotransferase subunit D
VTGGAQVPTWWYQASFRAFREEYVKADSVLLFVGPGVSMAGGIPSKRYLLLRLAKKHDNDYPAARPLRERIETLVAANTSDGCEKAASLMEGAYKALAAGELRKALSTLGGAKALQPSSAHHAIVRLKWSRLITTNRDTLLDAAARVLLGDDNLRVTYPGDNEFVDAKTFAGSPCIVKLNGDLAAPNSELLLSFDSFKELHDGAAADQYAAVVHTLLRTAQLILFVGYNDQDEYFRRFVKEVKANASRRPYAIVPREGGVTAFAQRVAELSRQLSVEFITYSPEAEHAELLEMLRYLEVGRLDEHAQTYATIAQRRKPTVVFLHCGGTIGATTATTEIDPRQPLTVVIKESRYDAELQAFSDQIRRWYKEAYTVANDVDIDIVWEILPVESQMFSENASPATWNSLRETIQRIIYKYFFAARDLSNDSALTPDEPLGQLYDDEDRQYRLTSGGEELSERRFRRDFMQRYVVGIVVLFGTDTLSFAASALALGLEHLPCPIVITGANQPPDEDNPLTSRAHFYAESDAWTNLRLSLLFLQCFGHRLTEVFVAFGGTIHNAINLRKRATDIIPSGRLLAHGHSEPFSFRNLSLRGQYMFKLIDGIFCDNFYSHFIAWNVSCYADLVEHGSARDIRHLRFDALAAVPPRETIGHTFSDRVCYFEITPAFPSIDVNVLTASGIRVILAQGYPSGTYPSVIGHNFTKLLADAYASGVPVVIISEYGILASQQEYQTQNKHSPVITLYEIVMETALPLLSLVVENIRDGAWAIQEGEEPAQVIARRIGLLKKGIEMVLKERLNILSHELKDVANRDGMLKASRSLMQAANDRVEHWHWPFQDRGRFPAVSDTRAAEANDNYAGGFAVLARSDLVAILDEFARLFEKVQAGPDGLEQVCNIGFDMGLPLWESFHKKRAYADSSRRTDVVSQTDEADFLFHQSPEEQSRRLQSAADALEDVCNLVDAAGLTRVLKKPILQFAKDAASFTVALEISRFDGGDALEAKYGVMTFLNHERDFFMMMEEGPQDGNVGVHMQHLERLYRTLLRTSWIHVTSTADWLFLGLFKGVTCGIAKFLALDHLTSRANSGDKRLREALRNRVRTRVMSVEQTHLSVVYEYSELGNIETS